MNLEHRLRQQITVASRSGVDGYGTPSYGAPRSMAALIEAGSRRVLTAGGEEILVEHRIFCAQAVELTDRVWLPGANVADPNAARRPERVEATPDHTGSVPFWLVYL